MKARVLRWMVVLTAFFAFACGGGDEDGGGGGSGGFVGPGGSGGDGGSGGTGGDEPGPGGSGGDQPGGSGGGGAGGTGGSEGVCGDGNLDPGEECDDGNRSNFDGCSTECRIEGTCDNPFNFRQMAVYDDARKLRAVYGDHVVVANMRSDQVNSCGGGVRSAVYLYRNGPERGYFSVLAETPPGFESSFTVAIRNSCSEPSTELACLPADLTQSDWMILSPGQEVFIVVDAISGLGDDTPYAVGAIFLPARGPGDPCTYDPLPSDPRCDEGLACAPDGKGDLVCQEDAPPTIDRVRAYRDGDRLIVLVDGQDEPGNVVAMWMGFDDQFGNPLTYPDYDVPEANLVFPNPSVRGKRSFRADFVDSTFFAKPLVAGTAEVAVRLVDDNGNESLEVVVPVEPIPVVGIGESCGTDGKTEKCADGLQCIQGICCTEDFECEP